MKTQFQTGNSTFVVTKLWVKVKLEVVFQFNTGFIMCAYGQILFSVWNEVHI